jgi:hypothetical protein
MHTFAQNLIDIVSQSINQSLRVDKIDETLQCFVDNDENFNVFIYVDLKEKTFAIYFRDADRECKKFDYHYKTVIFDDFNVNLENFAALFAALYANFKTRK